MESLVNVMGCSLVSYTYWMPSNQFHSWILAFLWKHWKKHQGSPFLAFIGWQQNAALLSHLFICCLTASTVKCTSRFRDKIPENGSWLHCSPLLQTAQPAFEWDHYTGIKRTVCFESQVPDGHYLQEWELADSQFGELKRSAHSIA